MPILIDIVEYYSYVWQLFDMLYEPTASSVSWWFVAPVRKFKSDPKTTYQTLKIFSVHWLVDKEFSVLIQIKMIS